MPSRTLDELLADARRAVERVEEHTQHCLAFMDHGRFHAHSDGTLPLMRAMLEYAERCLATSKKDDLGPSLQNSFEKWCVEQCRTIIRVANDVCGAIARELGVE